jgi:hypothetical protein
MGDGWTRMRAGGHAAALPSSLTWEERLRPKRVVHWLLAHWLSARIRRDIRRILRPLVAQGRASWLGDPPRGGNVPTATDLSRTVTRVRALFDPSISGGR